MDKRLIEKIENYENGLNLVNQMQPVTFQKKGSNKKELGLVAQDIQYFEPLTVYMNKGLLIIEHDKLIPVLINAIKVLSKEVEELKNNNLKSKKMK